MKILVTAFEPFGGDALNPTLEVLQRLPNTLEGAEIIKLQVPVVFGRSIEKVNQVIRDAQPDVILSLGLAGGRSDIGVERVAINIDDGRIPDNAGHQPEDEPIIPNAPAAYFSSLPIKAIVAAIRQQGIPASVSNTAGTYVCNHLMYGVLHHIAAHNLPTRAGFIHMPYLPGQVVEKPGIPSMELGTMVTAIEAAIRCLVDTNA